MAKDPSLNNFGLLIAYLLPGFALLWGLRPYFPGIDLLLGSPSETAPTVGGFLYATLAAVGAGVVLSTVRWMVIDTVHHATGLTPPAWDFARLRESPAAFDIVVEHYYRYYQAHANGLVAAAAVFAVRRWWVGLITGPFDAVDLGLVVLSAVLFVGSRDSLRRYYTRGGGHCWERLGSLRHRAVPRRRRRERATGKVGCKRIAEYRVIWGEGPVYCTVVLATLPRRASARPPARAC